MICRFSLRCFVCLGCLLLCVLLGSCQESVTDARAESSLPVLYPDYVGVTVPANIAPLNFCMADSLALLTDAVITGPHGQVLHGQGAETTDFDLDRWHQLLAHSVGDSLLVTVSARYADGWHTYQPFSLYVSADSIDYGLTYRLIEPGYEVYSKMGIYERDLSSFRQTVILENTQFQGCVNCHSVNRGNPRHLSLHIRGEHGATLLRIEGEMQAYDTSTPQTLGLCVYPYWHPSGRYIAYSTNTTRQLFHTQHPNRIEVIDAASDLQVYDIEHNRLLLSPLLTQDAAYETFPVFSADGRSLFFCTAPALNPGSMAFDSIHYSLCRIDFDPLQGIFGTQVDTLVHALRHFASPCTVTFPRPSYDGRFLCYTLADYGQFSIWHHEADLYMLDLQTGQSRPMVGVNSSDTESFHNWSSNSRWMVFSSRRHDGLFTRLYLTHIDAEGRESKPFLLPQHNPRRFYRDLFMSYNVPDFVTAPVQFDALQAVGLINDTSRLSMSVTTSDY